MADAAPDRRANDQWIRDALKEQKEDNATIREELAALHKEWKDFVDCAMASIPNKDPKAHLTAHEQWVLEKAEQKKKADEDAKLKLEVRNGLIKTAINASIVFVGGILLLGAQAQFGLWVNNVKPTPVVAVESDKKGGNK